MFKSAVCFVWFIECNVVSSIVVLVSVMSVVMLIEGMHVICVSFVLLSSRKKKFDNDCVGLELFFLTVIWWIISFDFCWLNNLTTVSTSLLCESSFGVCVTILHVVLDRLSVLLLFWLTIFFLRCMTAVSGRLVVSLAMVIGLCKFNGGIGVRESCPNIGESPHANVRLCLFDVDKDVSESVSLSDVTWLTSDAWFTTNTFTCSWTQTQKSKQTNLEGTQNKRVGN